MTVGCGSRSGGRSRAPWPWPASLAAAWTVPVDTLTDPRFPSGYRPALPPRGNHMSLR